MNLLDIVEVNVKPKISTRIFHRFHERIRSKKNRNIIFNFIKLFTGKKSEIHDGLSSLNERGIYEMPCFVDKKTINAIVEQLKKMECIDPWKSHSGKFYWNSIPPGTHVAQIPEVVRIDVLHKIATSPNIIKLVTGYFGSKPVLDSIQAWWSVPGNEVAEEAENFHRDNDAIKFLKLFIYATDVDDNSGPHVYVPGSHVGNDLIERRRYSDDEVYEKFSSNGILRLCGNAGDAFIEDTYGLHKGQLPVSGYRLLIQFRYSVLETVFRSPIIVSGAEKSIDVINIVSK